MGDTIWVASNNEQDDYSPIAVFDKAFDAESFAKWMELNGAGVSFAELPYNPSPKEYISQFKVKLYALGLYRNGEARYCQETDDAAAFSDDYCFFYKDSLSEAYLACRIWAKNQRQAISIARKQVKERIDKGEWKE